MSKAPMSRQTLLFSATLPAPILKLAERFMFHPVVLEVERPSLTATKIDQVCYEVKSPTEKLRLIRDLIKRAAIRKLFDGFNRSLLRHQVSTIASNATFGKPRTARGTGDMALTTITHQPEQEDG